MPVTQTSSRTQLRAVTVLFADIVSFTPLAQASHAEDVRELLSDYFTISRTVVARYGGRIEKFVGDAVMAVWGTPTATADDAERAVRAALDLVDAAAAFDPPLTLRVGIATGMAAVSTDSTDEHLVAGDVVALASRVQSTATPGEVWVDNETREATANAITYRDRGSHGLKGRQQPELLHAADAVLAERGGRGRPHVLHVPLAGYRREFATIRDTLNATSEEGRGRLLVLTGDAGTGKSRLGLELQNYADGIEGGVRWHWTRCASLAGTTPYAALASAVRGRLGASDSGPEALEAQLDLSLDVFVPDPGRRAWLRSALGVLLGLDSQEFAREDLFAAWTTWFETLASEGDTVVWVIDDAHDADDSLLDFVQHLVSTAQVALMVMMMGRPELLERRPQLATQRGSTLLGIDGLGATAMNELLDRLVSGLTDETRSRLAEQAGNVPLFAMESVRGMMDRGEVIEHDGTRSLLMHDFSSAPTPTLSALITSRLDLLSAFDRRVLQEASVYGASFTALDVASLAARPIDEVATAFIRLAERDLIAPSRSTLSSDFGRHSFVHALVRQVAYESLSRDYRSQLHMSAASILSRNPQAIESHSGAIVEHLVLARELGHGASATGLDLTEWLVKAADRAMATGGHPEALRDLELAISSTAEDERVADLHVRAAEVCFLLRRLDDCLSHAEAISTADVSVRLRAALVTTRALQRLARYDDALATLEPWRERPPGIDDRLAAEWATIWGFLLYVRGDSERSLEWSRRAVSLADNTGDPVRMHEALNLFAAAHQVGGLGIIVNAVHTEAARIARDNRLNAQLGRTLYNISIGAVSRGDLATAISSLREAVPHVARGDGGLHVTALAGLIGTLVLTGQLDEAADHAARLDAITGDVTEKNAGELAEAVSQMVTLKRTRGEPVPTHLGPLYKRLFEGEADDAQRQWYARALVACNGDDAGPENRALARWLTVHERDAFGEEQLFGFWPTATRLSIRAAAYDEARELLALVDGVSRGANTTLLRAVIESYRWMLEAADPASTADDDIVEQKLRSALGTLDRIGAVLEHARATASLASLLRRRGKVDDARALRAGTAAALTEVGALGLLREITN